MGVHETSESLGTLSKQQPSTSLTSILGTLIPTTITAVIFLAIFISIRVTYKKIYTPRTFLATIPKEDRTPSSSSASSYWYHDFKSLDDKFVLQHQSLDGYLFLRFFRSIIFICLVGCIVTWPILLPINATGGGSASQLDRFAFGNINDNNRLYAHAVVAWAFLSFVVLFVTREQLFLIGMRQAYLSLKPNINRLSSRVVLFLFAPGDALKKEKLQEIFGSEARSSWAVSDQSKLEGLVQERNDRAMTLEAAQVELARTANMICLDKKNDSQTNGVGEDVEGSSVKVPHELRPKKRLTPLIGEKVDTVDWALRTLPDLRDQVEKGRLASRESIKPGRSAIFVAYSTPEAAQRAFKDVKLHGLVSKLTPDRFIGVEANEVLWSNLVLSPHSRIIRASLATALVMATILLWAIPIAVVGAISNISYLTDKVKFLRFLDNLPSSVIGLLSGLLPPLAISSLVSMVPQIFRYIAKLSGETTVPRAELWTQRWYFVFQVIQVFLVTALSSGAVSVATKIAQDPGSTPALLATYLPLSSNFYLTLIILQGTASAANNVLNYSDLLKYLFFGRFLDKTPRDKYTRFTSMKNMSWGKVFPKFANLAVIAITYSCIAPLILGFSLVGLYLFYQSYRYNLLYVIQTKVDTRGDSYGKALQHLLTGVYLSEICLIGLFGARQAPGPTTLMIILFIVTVIYHSTVSHVLASVKGNIAAVREEETVPLLAAEEGHVERDEPLQAPSKPAITGLSWLPHSISERLAEIVTASVDRSRKTASSWFHDPSARLDTEDIHYTEEEMDNAYLNPALTSKTPKIWLVKDEAGISEQEKSGNEAAGIPTSNDGAFLDEKNHVIWAQDDFNQVPLFKPSGRA